MTPSPVEDSDLDPDGFFRLRGVELAMGWAPGRLSCAIPEDVPESPRAALDDAMLPVVARERCFVAFSGGRDSSAVLAAAVTLARAHGLADPVPVTRIYPEQRDLEEERFQELLVRHLRLREWVRLEVTHEQDLLGPQGADALRRHGLLFPVGVHSLGLLHPVARGGDLLTGEGGDEVLGAHRINSIVIAVTGKRRPSRRVLGALAYNSAPRRVRRRMVRNSLASNYSHLRPQATGDALAALAADFADEPLSWEDAKIALLGRRPVVRGLANMDRLAAAASVRLHHPLLETSFVVSLAKRGGFFGFPGRTASLTSLFGDELPAEVLARTSKAAFNTIVMGPSSRAFAAEWDGTGVDEHIVDVEALRAAWNEDLVSATVLPLLQAAWLHAAGLPLSGFGARAAS